MRNECLIKMKLNAETLAERPIGPQDRHRDFPVSRPRSQSRDLIIDDDGEQWRICMGEHL